MESICIKKVDSIDVEGLQKISRQTFFETFADKNTAEDMAKFLEENYSLSKLTAELADENSFFYFALSDEEVIGFLKLNTSSAQTESLDSNALEIERIYVLKAYHGKKVGQLLYEKALETARQLNAAYVWLGVWEKNPRAISFYQKNGFTPFDKHIFRLGDDEQTDILMKLPLQNR